MCRVCQKLHFNKQFDVVEGKLKKAPMFEDCKNHVFLGCFLEACRLLNKRNFLLNCFSKYAD